MESRLADSMGLRVCLAAVLTNTKRHDHRFHWCRQSLTTIIVVVGVAVVIVVVVVVVER